MSYEIPSTDELQQRALDGIAAEFPALRTTEGSVANSETLASARLASDQQQRLGQLDRNVTPATADERGLAQWSVALEVPRNGPTTSRGTQALEVSGSPGATVALALALEHVSSGLLYETTSGATIGAGGTANVDIQSIDTGTQTRLIAGEPLRFTAPPVGIDQTARLISSLTDGGADEEPIGAWRNRQTLVWRDKRVAGSESGYLLEALSQLDVVSAFLYRRKPTAGSISVMAFKAGTGTAKLQTLTERNALQAALADEMVNDTVIALEPVPRIVHVDALVSLIPGNARAFADDYTVATWNPSTATLVVNEVLAADVGVGDLLTIESALPDATGASGKPVTVAAITGPSSLVLVSVDGAQPVLDFTPAAADVVRPSGPALLDAWNTIRFGATDCATVAGLESLGPANPGFNYGAWLSDMRVDEIRQLAKAPPGIDDATVVLSTTNPIEYALEFVFPDDAQVEVLFPGQVVVR